jgi:hypothetical protein
MQNCRINNPIKKNAFLSRDKCSGFLHLRIKSLYHFKLNLNMKKIILGMFALATLGLGSCGETLMTEAQMAAAVSQGVEAQKAAVVAEEDAKCALGHDEKVTAEAQRIVEDTNAAKEAEKKAAADAAAAAKKGKKK